MVSRIKNVDDRLKGIISGRNPILCDSVDELRRSLDVARSVMREIVGIYIQVVNANVEP